MLQNVQIGTFVILMCAAMFTDLNRMRIPNVLVLMCLGSFYFFALISGMPATEIGWHSAAAIVVLVIALLPYSLGAMAAGDVKLIAAIGLWFGFGDELVAFVLLMSAYGGALAFALLGFRQLPLPAPVKGWEWASRLYNPTNGVPYGVAIAGAAITLRHAII